MIQQQLDRPVAHGLLTADSSTEPRRSAQFKNENRMVLNQVKEK
jgi:hypothetical protein